MRKGLSWRKKKLADSWLLEVFLWSLLLVLVRRGRLAGDCWWSSSLLERASSFFLWAEFAVKKLASGTQQGWVGFPRGKHHTAS